MSGGSSAVSLRTSGWIILATPKPGLLMNRRVACSCSVCVCCSLLFLSLTEFTTELFFCFESNLNCLAEVVVVVVTRKQINKCLLPSPKCIHHNLCQAGTGMQTPGKTSAINQRIKGGLARTQNKSFFLLFRQ